MGGKRVIIKAVKTLLYLDSEKLILKLMLATLMFIATLFTITERWKQPRVGKPADGRFLSEMPQLCPRQS